MKKIFFVIAVLILLNIFLLAVILFSKFSSSLSIQVESHTKTYSVTYKPTEVFTTYLKEIDFKKNPTMQKALLKLYTYKIIIEDLPKTQTATPDKDSITMPIKASSTTDSEQIYTTKIVVDPDIRRLFEEKFIANMVLSAVLFELEKINNPRSSVEEIGLYVQQVQKKFHDSQSANPFVVTYN